MSQYDFGTIDPATTSGTALATLLGSFRTALESQHSGSSRPAYAIAGTLWLDTTGTPWILKIYDGADDISLGTINATTNVFALAGALAAAGTTHTITSTDAGAIGPILDIYHNSASPLIGDAANVIRFSANSSTGTKRTVGQISTSIIDPTNATEDVDMHFTTIVGGAAGNPIHLSGNALIIDGQIKPNANDSASLGISGTAFSDVFVASGGVINANAGEHTITHVTAVGFDVSGVLRMDGSNSAPGVGTNGSGWAFNGAGSGFFSAAGTSALFANRTLDGAVISIGSQGVTQGTISVAGATCSYNPFFGSHYSQPETGHGAFDFLPGTIVESVDELSDIGELGERLPRYKISDEAGSDAVYGVLHRHQDRVEATEDDPGVLYEYDEIGALGAYWIRIAAGHVVHRGDLIESNGDGCGRVQNGKNMRSSTVGKVTAAVVVETYPDGSYLAPCTLHCG